MTKLQIIPPHLEFNLKPLYAYNLLLPSSIVEVHTKKVADTADFLAIPFSQSSQHSFVSL